MIRPPAKPPVADRRPHSYSHHGVTIEDPYHWLKDQGYPQVDDPDVLAYLTRGERLLRERDARRAGSWWTRCSRKSRRARKPDDAGVPYKDGDWYYRWHFEEGGQLPLVWKRWPARDAGAPDSHGGNAETILNEPELAAAHDYFRLGALSVEHHRGDLLAYSTDTDGSERYRLFVRDLKTGELLEDTIENTLGARGLVRGRFRVALRGPWTRTGVPTRCAGTCWAKPWKATPSSTKSMIPVSSCACRNRRRSITY